MKKRVLISIIFTIIFTAITYHLWYHLKPVSIDIGAEKLNDCTITVQINKKNNFEFEKNKEVSKSFTNNQTSSINNNELQTFLLERKDVSRGRKLRIIISDLNINHTFIIKYIKINNKNYDLNKFKSKNCRIAAVNNELNILPPPRG